MRTRNEQSAIIRRRSMCDETAETKMKREQKKNATTDDVFVFTLFSISIKQTICWLWTCTETISSCKSNGILFIYIIPTIFNEIFNSFAFHLVMSFCFCHEFASLCPMGNRNGPFYICTFHYNAFFLLIIRIAILFYI